MVVKLVKTGIPSAQRKPRAREGHSNSLLLVAAAVYWTMESSQKRGRVTLMADAQFFGLPLSCVHFPGLSNGMVVISRSPISVLISPPITVLDKPSRTSRKRVLKAGLNIPRSEARADSLRSEFRSSIHWFAEFL